jgi:hypothetical protein
MADYPFVIPLQQTINAGLTGTYVFSISSTESMKISRIYTNTVTAGVNIVNIRDQGGRGYMPPGTAGFIPLAMVGNSAQPNENNVLQFDMALEIPAQGSLIVDVQNTTGGSVTPTLVVVGIKSQLGA